MKQFISTAQGKATLVVLGILILLGVVYGFGRSDAPGPGSPTPTGSFFTTIETGDMTSTPSPSVSSSPKRSPRTSATSFPTQVSRLGTEGLTYGEAINKYTANRIQLNTSCQASPSQLILKKGAKIMIDNRASVARAIAIDGKTYSLEAYGFSIFSLSGSVLPHTAHLDCGASKNVAKFIIQG